MNLYDKSKKRIIVFLKESATSNFWDKHWQKINLVENIKKGRNNRMLRKITGKFLKPPAKILEGGCGIGQNVYGLKCRGYNAYGVDYAKETMARTKDKFPELKISVQDVRKLDFPDNFFDGYWSLGVIEHFWDGYKKILIEMKRVIRPKGYLFLSFPWMSPLRRLKVKMKLYKTLYNVKIDKNDFYEFILNEKKVARDLEKNGFKLVMRYPFDAVKGLKDEIFLLRPILQKIYNSQNIFAKGIRFLTSLLFSRPAGHMILLVFQKNEE